MQTHEDEGHRRKFLNRLQERADDMVRDRASEITAGKEGEAELGRWKHAGVHVTHLPPDEQGILRISIGGGLDIVPMNYCVFRGDRGPCIYLLKKAIRALEAVDAATG
jgi:hypothetical protein